MNTKFKRHQKVRLLIAPDSEYVEYHHADDETKEKPSIKKGMLGKINLILPNGQYHVEILNPKDESDVIAYAPMDEDSLEAAD